MIYLTSLHFFLKFLIGSAYIMPYVRKLKTKMSTLRYLLQKLKNKAGHSKKRYYYCGIIDHDVIQVPWLSKNKIVIPLLPIPAHHISCEDFFGQSNFFLCRISQFSQEITLRQIN